MEILLSSCSRLTSPAYCRSILTSKTANNLHIITKRWNQVERHQDGSIKFTKSEAHIDYKATKNFYGYDNSLPPTHNAVLAGSGIFGIVYLFLLRDHEMDDQDGGKDLLKPLHETMPHLAIPLLTSAIAENRKFGYDTKKLEAKLAEYMKNPDKYGGGVKKLVEN